MSLIHEALKRAEADKRRNSPFFDNLTVLPPVDDDMPPPPRPEPRRQRRRALPVLSAVGLVLMGGGLAGGWYVWARARGEAGPKAAIAVAPPAHSAPGATTLPGVTNSKPPQAAPQPAEHTQPARPHAKVSLDAEMAFARGMAEMKYYQPPGEPGAARQPGPGAAPGRGQANQPVGAVPKVGPAPRQAQPAGAAAAATEPDRSKFRLSAVMCGPEGNAALINGNLFHEGQIVQGARIVRIGRYHVELELGGQSFTIRMSS